MVELPILNLSKGLEKMKVHIDLTLVRDSDINQNFILSDLYSKIHIAFVANKDSRGNSPVAVAFPKYSMKDHSLGGVIRLMAESEGALKDLNLSECFGGSKTYVRMSEIKPIPSNIDRYVRYQRVTKKPNNEKRARRICRNKDLDYNEVLNRLNSEQSQRQKDIKEPFVWMVSNSNKNRFPLFIKEVIMNEAGYDQVELSCYGLSSKGSLPMF